MKIIFLLLISSLFINCAQKDLKQQGMESMQIDTNDFSNLHQRYKETALKHRRFKHSDVDSLIQLHKAKEILQINEIGKSFEGRSIYELTFGEGDKHIMMWSQMHGDEPTATMALFDLFNFLEGQNDGFDSLRLLIKSKVKIHFIPMLNPDGAERYNRRTAQHMDMNRDARAGQSVEGTLLRARAASIKPQYGFNLHDQNIYYNVPGTKNPVTISLLAPAYNENRDINDVRAGAMQLIVGMNNLLQQYIPDAVAKYDDTHTPRGFGDNFQSWDASTILIESGGKKGDPEKQEIRKLNFIIILNALKEIAESSYKQYAREDYEKIPFNASQLHDVVIRNLEVSRDSTSYTTDIALRRNEITVNRDYYVRGKVEDIGDLLDLYGYDEIDAKGLKFVPGKVFEKSLPSLQQISWTDIESLLRGGYIAAPIQAVGATKVDALHNFPINLYTQKNFYPNQTIDFGGVANFFLADTEGRLKYAIVNGYLIDLSRDLKGQLFKNKIH